MAADKDNGSPAKKAADAYYARLTAQDAADAKIRDDGIQLLRCIGNSIVYRVIQRLFRKLPTPEQLLEFASALKQRRIYSKGVSNA